MPRRRHVRIALQITVVSITVIFILSFFPGTPASVYNSDDALNLAGLKPSSNPLKIISASPSIAPESTSTSREHSSQPTPGLTGETIKNPVNDGSSHSQGESPEEKTDKGKDIEQELKKTEVEKLQDKKLEKELMESKPEPGSGSDLEKGESEENKHETWRPEKHLTSKPNTHKTHNSNTKIPAPKLTSHSFTKVIFDRNEQGPTRLSCPEVSSSRYSHLAPGKLRANSKRKYYFALDLFDAQSILPTLMGAIVETIRFLGPHNCAVTIVEGRSRDWTYDILAEVGEALSNMGVQFNLTTNPVDPLAEGGDRITALAELRNQALQPLFDHPGDYSLDTTVLFINDIAVCVDDILELVHQLEIQNADLTCSMDWQSRGSVFYDFWVSRAINGDSFFEIPQSGSWEFNQNMFWNEPKSKSRMEALQPVQVYSCWNGMVVFKAKPLLKNNIRFRDQREHECYMGEPTYLCKDLWASGHGRIAIIPSVNVAYTVTEGTATKKYRGYVDEVVEYAESTDLEELIDWQKDPPPMVKCAKTWDSPSWVPPL